MKYILLLLLLAGCATPQPIRYFPEGTQGNSVPYYSSQEGVICSKTGEKVHYFKITNKGEIIGSQYYADNLKYK